MFREEYDQLKSDRNLLRNDIMKSKPLTDVAMPVNLPRVITNILSEN